MSIDLSKCKPNQKVITRKGNTGIFTGCSDDPGPWPYEVSFNTIIVSYTQEGYLLDKFAIRGQDIVEVLPLDWPDPKLTSPSLLELQQELDSLKSQIAALRKENEILKAQIAEKLKLAEDKVSEWRSYWRTPDFDGVMSYQVWYPSAFNRWKYPIK